MARKVGIWSEELLPPRGPAEIAVFDPATKKTRWTYKISKNHPSLPANDFWTTIDQSQMVVAGRWAHVAWVDISGQQATLRLVSLDVHSDSPAPVERAIPLDFPTKGNESSALMDLICADGSLYALVTQSGRLWVRDPRWTAQHVVALR